jgi:hypothetical protein
MKLLLVSLLILGGAFSTFAQSTISNSLSNEDKSEIIESVLKQEAKAQSQVGEFRNIKILSSENIEFIEPSKILELGFILLGSAQINERKGNGVIEYLVFRRLLSNDGKVTVTLSRVSEGHPCFGPAFLREQKFTYEYRNESGAWIGELTARTFPISFGKNLNTKQ